jgi:hypothetical protein
VIEESLKDVIDPLPELLDGGRDATRERRRQRRRTRPHGRR